MNKGIRSFVLAHSVTREMFFILGKRKTNLKKIDRKIAILDEKEFSARPVTNDLIVSLTSYGERLKELKYTLYSLVAQSIRPEKIIVNISEADNSNLPNELVVFKDFGVEFYVCENLRSYKKLVPTLIRYPNKTIITCDDDIFYKFDLLKKLWDCHKSFPFQIICHNVYNITTDEKNILPYDCWIHNAKVENSTNRNFFVGVGGVLYPPQSLYKDVADARLFKKLSPLADDIWFYFMAVMQGTKIRQVHSPNLGSRYVNPYREYGITEGQTLTQQNVAQGKNDSQFRAIMKYYNIDETALVNFINGNDMLISFTPPPPLKYRYFCRLGINKHRYFAFGLKKSKKLEAK